MCPVCWKIGIWNCPGQRMKGTLTSLMLTLFWMILRCFSSVGWSIHILRWGRGSFQNHCFINIFLPCTNALGFSWTLAQYRPSFLVHTGSSRFLLQNPICMEMGQKLNPAQSSQVCLIFIRRKVLKFVNTPLLRPGWRQVVVKWSSKGWQGVYCVLPTPKNYTKAKIANPTPAAPAVKI